jgi:hypothetical protein
MANRTPSIHTDIPVPDMPSPRALHKQRFIMNALDKGWTVKKRNGKYILTKRHKGNPEVFQEDYLEKMMAEML